MADRGIVGCVDDNDSVREALGGLLLSIGCTAVLFASAEAFLLHPGKGDMACLITDIRLGGMSGLELLRVLAARGDAIPAIVISSLDEPRLREQALHAGAVGFLCKPVCDAELLVLLEGLLGRGSP